MSDSKIDWLGGWKTRDGRARKARSWNPGGGCSKYGKGCKNCYAEAAVGSPFTGLAKPGRKYEGLVTVASEGRPAEWTGKVRLMPERLGDPLSWSAPSTIFVDSTFDAFKDSHENDRKEIGEGFTDTEIAAIMGALAAAENHIFVLLTKRIARARRWFQWASTLAGGPGYGCAYYAWKIGGVAACGLPRTDWPWPPKNLILGCSIADQEEADELLPHLVAIPDLACRLVSYEPALGAVDFRRWFQQIACDRCTQGVMDAGNPHLFGACRCACHPKPAIGWIIGGCESGPGARPFDEDNMRLARDRCVAAGVPFYYKQRPQGRRVEHMPVLDGQEWAQLPDMGM